MVTTFAVAAPGQALQPRMPPASSANTACVESDSARRTFSRSLVPRGPGRGEALRVEPSWRGGGRSWRGGGRSWNAGLDVTGPGLAGRRSWQCYRGNRVYIFLVMTRNAVLLNFSAEWLFCSFKYSLLLKAGSKRFRRY